MGETEGEADYYWDNDQKGMLIEYFLFHFE